MLFRASKRQYMQAEAEEPGRGILSLSGAIETLHLHEPELRAAGVRHAAVFGSVARGDAVDTSDIDILIELDPAAHVSLFELMGIERRLTEIYGRKVDVVSRGGLRPRLVDSILADAVSAF